MPDLTEQQQQQYTDLIDELHAKTEPRAMALLSRIRDVCREAGMSTDDEPTEMGGDDYRWTLMVWRAGETAPERGIDISVEIAETLAYGDHAEQPFGISFALEIVEFGGRILGELRPFNYTDHCWVDLRDPEAVEQRWSILDQADLSDIPNLCNA